MMIFVLDGLWHFLINVFSLSFSCLFFPFFSNDENASRIIRHQLDFLFIYYEKRTINAETSCMILHIQYRVSRWQQ